MTYVEQAIREAVKGGYKASSLDFLLNLPEYAQSQLWIDPLFWLALSKARDWKVTDYCFGCGYDEGSTDNTPVWKVKWHRFIDHLADGKDAESYFKSLLGNDEV